MNHGVVQRWLREVVQPYHGADRVYADVDQTLVSVSSLSPKTEVYTYDDGRTQLLLLLSGTIPIQYRGATYNIPVDIWVPRIYPREPPIAYVRPTNDMLIRKGKHVDVSGRIGGDYLDRWERKWESCNLLQLVHSCQDMFGQEPPVYAKPKQTVNSSPAASPIASSSRSPLDPRERKPPAPPQEQSSQQPLTSSHDGVPLRPPKPAGSYSGHDGSSNVHIPASPAGWTVLPGQPKTGPLPNTSPEHAMNGHGWERSPDRQQSSGSWHGATDGRSPLWSRQSIDFNRQNSSVQSTYDVTMAVPSPGVAPPLSTHPRSPLIASPPPTTPSSAALPAPPRPPNPELLQMHSTLHHKIQLRLQHIRNTSGESRHQLRLLIDDLDRGEAAIHDEMARLEAVRDVCRATGDGLQEAVSSANARTLDLKSRSEPDVDGMICATSIVGNQLIDLVAGDTAIGDTLFYLGQALNSEAIEVERFLKQTRFLAREQFMRRALAQKITQGMGW